MRFFLSASILALSAGAAASATCSSTAPAGATVISGEAGHEAAAAGIYCTEGEVSGASHGFSDDGEGGRIELYNIGTLTGLDKDGANIDRDASVTNSGRIIGADDAIQGGESLTVTNSGIIEADDEGVTADDLTIINSGSIRAIDDAINSAGLTLINSGLIENVAGPYDEPQDAIDIDYGSITNSGTIRSSVDGAIDFDAADHDASIQNGPGGVISGVTGILVEKGLTGEPANIRSQAITNSGMIEGTAGLALDLGAGEDSYAGHAGSRLLGGADMGDDDDVFELVGRFPGAFSEGTLIDGGAGTDVLKLAGFLWSDLLGVMRGADDSLTMSLASTESPFSISFARFEEIVFGDRTESGDAIAALATDPAPIPLPAGGVLLLTALTGLGLARRRR